MRLTSIEAQNLKGQSFKHELAAINCFVGPNGAGKSARKEAIILATNRFIPQYGDKESLTYQLASGADMTVIATADNGRTSKQVWSNKSPKYSGQPICSNPAELADLSMWTDKTGPAKIAHVFKLVDPAKMGFTETDIMRALVAIEPAGERASAVKATMIEETKLHIHESKGKPIQEWVAELVKSISEEFSSADKEFKGLNVKQSSEVKSDGGELFAEEVPADIEQQLADAREKEDAVKQQRNKNQILIDVANATVAKIEQSKLAKSVEISPGDPDQIEKEIVKLTAEREAIVLDVFAHSKLLSAATKDEGAKSRVTAAEKSRDTFQSKLNSFSDDACCSECGRKYPKASRDEARQKLKSELAELNAEFTAALAAQKKTSVARQEAQAAIKTEQSRVDKIQAIIAKQDELTRKRNSIESARAKAQATTPNYGDEAELRKQLAECEAKSKTLTEQCAEASANVSRLAQLNEKRIAKAQDAKRAQEALEAKWEAQAKAEIYGKAKKELQKCMDEFNSKVWNELLSIAQRVFAGAFPFKLEVRDGEFGYMAGEKFVCETLSEAQRYIVNLATQIALCRDAEFRAIHLDGPSGPLDDIRFAQLMVNLEALLADGTVHQVFIYDWSPRVKTIKGANVIELA